MIAFRPTDLPWPVAPATRRCGALARSKVNTSLVMVFPKATGSSILASWKAREAIQSRMETVFGSLFGTSIPIAALPGIGAMIRIPLFEAIDIAISSLKFFTRLIFVPETRTISKSVMVGPTVAEIL